MGAEVEESRQEMRRCARVAKLRGAGCVAVQLSQLLCRLLSSSPQSCYTDDCIHSFPAGKSMYRRHQGSGLQQHKPSAGQGRHARSTACTLRPGSASQCGTARQRSQTDRERLPAAPAASRQSAAVRHGASCSSRWCSSGRDSASLSQDTVSARASHALPPGLGLGAAEQRPPGPAASAFLSLPLHEGYAIHQAQLLSPRVRGMLSAALSSCLPPC